MDVGVGLEGLAPDKTLGARDGLHSNIGADPLLNGGEEAIDLTGDYNRSNNDFSRNDDWAF